MPTASDTDALQDHSNSRVRLMDFDVRAFRDKAGDGRRGERFDKLRAVERRDIRFELRRLRGPNSPARMFDPVFAAAGTPRGVTPVMFGDEFFVRSLRRGLRLARRGHGQRFPALPRRH